MKTGFYGKDGRGWFSAEVQALRKQPLDRSEFTGRIVDQGKTYVIASTVSGRDLTLNPDHARKLGLIQ
ncbi:hypothetical protein GTO10_02530 [Candidatus Saccharibacteria bacterium]|nr:hypothetical protein [Candidatus Saccharibacteria bacterium]